MIPGGEAVAYLEDVTHRYGKVAALDAVTLALPAGQIVGLIGPDGVGKSSLLAILAGARQIQSGKANVLGGDIADSAHRAAPCGATSRPLIRYAHEKAKRHSHRLCRDIVCYRSWVDPSSGRSDRRPNSGRKMVQRVSRHSCRPPITALVGPDISRISRGTLYYCELAARSAAIAARDDAAHHLQAR